MNQENACQAFVKPLGFKERQCDIPAPYKFWHEKESIQLCESHYRLAYRISARHHKFARLIISYGLRLWGDRDFN